MLTLNTYSSSNNNGANIFWGSCSLETSNQKFFPSYIGSVFWGVQQFYGIFKNWPPISDGHHSLQLQLLN